MSKILIITLLTIIFAIGGIQVFAMSDVWHVKTFEYNTYQDDVSKRGGKADIHVFEDRDNICYTVVTGIGYSGGRAVSISCLKR